jgi:hypothetical protein
MQATRNLHPTGEIINPGPNHPEWVWDAIFPPDHVSDPSIWIGRWSDGVFRTAAIIPHGHRLEAAFLTKLILDALNSNNRPSRKAPEPAEG